MHLTLANFRLIGKIKFLRCRANRIWRAAKSRPTCLHPLWCSVTSSRVECRKRDGRIYPRICSWHELFYSFPPEMLPGRRDTTFMVPFCCGTMMLKHDTMPPLALRFLVFVNRATANRATGGNATFALNSDIIQQFSCHIKGEVMKPYSLHLSTVTCFN